MKRPQTEASRRAASKYYARNRDKILEKAKAARKAMTPEEKEDARAADRARHRAKKAAANAK